MRTESIFDTHNLVKHLKKSGLNEKQAEGVVHAISESGQFDMANLATKTDLMEVKYDIIKWIIPFLVTIIGLIISLMFQGK